MDQEGASLGMGTQIIGHETVSISQTVHPRVGSWGASSWLPSQGRAAGSRTCVSALLVSALSQSPLDVLIAHIRQFGNLIKVLWCPIYLSKVHFRVWKFSSKLGISWHTGPVPRPGRSCSDQGLLFGLGRYFQVSYLYPVTVIVCMSFQYIHLLTLNI